MPYSVHLVKSAQKELERLPNKDHDRIVGRLTALKENPKPYGSQKLRGREEHKLRVGDFRIITVWMIKLKRSRCS